MKTKFALFTVSMLAACVVAGCSSEGGGGEETSAGGAKFEAGKPPVDISGCYATTLTVAENTCEAITKNTMKFCLSQQDDKVTYHPVSTSSSSTPAAPTETDEISSSGGGSATSSVSKTTLTGSSKTGVVSGNSFKIEDDLKIPGENCTVEMKGSMIGTVTGDSITGVQTIAVVTSGTCQESTLKNCNAAATYTGTKTGSYSAGASSGSATSSLEAVNIETAVPDATKSVERLHEAGIDFMFFTIPAK